MVPPDARRHAAATARNRDPILNVLRTVLPADGRWLEVASGSGEHTAHFASAFPHIQFQPSDVEDGALASIDAWTAFGEAPNIAPALILDVRSAQWPVAGELDVIYNANMIHISPWACCLGLMRGAGTYLRVGGMLILYGPYRVDGVHTAPSNDAFDRSLRQQDSSWGVRDLEAVVAAAADAGLALEGRHQLPANNQLLVFRR